MDDVTLWKSHNVQHMLFDNPTQRRKTMVTLSFEKHSAKIDVSFEALLDDTVLTINGKNVNKAGISYLLQYGLKQALSDSYASAKTKEEVEGLFNKRLDKIFEGGVIIRQQDGKSLERTIAREMILQACRAKGKAAPKGDLMKKLIEDMLLTRRDKIEEEVLRRKESVQDINLDDLLA